MMMYLDYNAAAPLLPEAKAAMLRVLEMTGNPSSVHGFGRRLRQEIETARQSVAALVGAHPHEVVFTSGGTEANNLVLRAFGAGQHVMVSAGEHPSMIKAASRGMVVPLTTGGSIRFEGLESVLNAVRSENAEQCENTTKCGNSAERENTDKAENAEQCECPILVSVMMANNETGVLNPMDDIVAWGRDRGVYLHSDAVQAVGKIPVDLSALDLDYLTISAHKIGGPHGVGALIIRHESPFVAGIVGGGQEGGRRAGTEDAASIAGFGAAAAVATLSRWGQVAALRDDFEKRLLTHIPEAIIFGSMEPRLPNTCCFALPGLSNDIQLMHLDLAGIAVSSGSACSSGRVEPSSVLLAMGVPPDLAACAIRVSLGLESSQSELDALFSQLMQLRSRRHKHAVSVMN